MIITIDGPTASGKSTVAVELAHKLGYYYLNTGFLYRSISYLLMSKYGYKLSDLAHPKVADIKEILDPVRFQYTYQNGQAGVSYDGVVITPFLKTKENDRASSIVSGNPMVREALLDYQRHFTKNYNVVAEGRDTGTVVFPNADIKIFLTATLEERARRWQEMQRGKGATYTLEQAVAAVHERDERDSSRDIAPLTIPAGATVFDNTLFDQQQTIVAITDLVAVFVSLNLPKGSVGTNG